MGSTAFDPLTFGYEWETFLTGRNMIPIKSDEVKRLGQNFRLRSPKPGPEPIISVVSIPSSSR